MSDYVQKLTAWVSAQQSPPHGHTLNAVLFLALRADVESALKAGYDAKTIWSHLHATGRIPYTYRTFLRHIQSYIHGPAATAANASIMPTQAPQAQNTQAHEPKGMKPRPSALQGFVFSPHLRREDLI